MKLDIKLVYDSLFEKLNYKLLIEKSIGFITLNQKKIPFANLLIWYLKIPFLLKIFITIFAGYILNRIFYTTGFIILQSKAKNEALSFISAFQNPIDFPDDLVYKYSLMIFSVFVTVLLPFFVVLVLHFLLANNIEKIESDKSRKRKKLQFYIFLFITFVVAFICALYSFSFIPYIMLFSSKEISIVESFFRYISGRENSILETSILNYDYLNDQIKYSFGFEIIGLIILFLLGFGVQWITKGNKNFIVDLLSKGTLSIALFVGLLIMISHTLYSSGYFGKSLANFDLDYVKVEYTLNGSKTIQGLRIYENDNKIILRDGCNVTHSITSEELHVISVSNFGECVQNK